MARPFILDPLFRSLTVLPGVGPRHLKLFERLIGGQKVRDLLWHFPIEFVDRRFSCRVAEAPDGKIVTIALRVQKHFPNARKGQPYRVRCGDESGTINLVFFHARKDWIRKQLPEGKDVVVSGKVEHYQGNIQMVHPDAIVSPEQRESLDVVEPVYPLTQGLTNKVVRRAVSGALKHVPDLSEWLEPNHKNKNGWPSWRESIESVHAPVGPESLNPLDLSRSRLAYDELLANQLTLALVRQRNRKKSGRSFETGGGLRQKILDALPFSLTGAQERALFELDSDMSAPSRLLRLLQGDVGSGKTVVACLAMMNAVESGAQAALMAPTEILARQHAETLKPWLDRAGVRFVILTGRDKGKDRDVILQQIRSGAAQIIIGTHALFQDSVLFHDLGLAVIDEQHRFGVHQRLKLSAKSAKADVLVMTATPIPRTLALTAYGDMEISRLDEKPPGRKPVDTRLIPIEKIEDMVAGLKRRVADGARVYWVCPLVEESEHLDLAAAEERYDILQSWFGDRVGLVHGRMKPEDKDAMMERFIGGSLDILVATTVIEVGVNVPEATIMIIEHAERFGLSQLHQLRGRVGRGQDQSYCFLMYGSSLGETAKERLSIMRETEDGFVIAEKDLELRGGGDVLGVRQSGMPGFKVANLSVHGDLLAVARDDAQLILSVDPDLVSHRGEALKILLYLFEQDRAIKYLKSG